MNAQVVVVGSLNMDLVVRSPRMPSPGETILGHGFRTVPGGKGANQAVAAARLGASVSLVGRVGKDVYGQALLNNLADVGIGQSCIFQDSAHPTGVAIIVVDSQGQNSIVVASGANMQLSVSDVNQASNHIAAADILLLQLESPLETVLAAAEIARRHDVTVLLNPAPAQKLPAALLSIVDVLVPNENEAAFLTDLPTQSREGAIIAIKKLAEQTAGDVILTLGERGALAMVNGRIWHVPAFPVHAVDTTAAGDAFVAGLAVALAEGQSFDQAIQRGSAAGALASTAFGAQSSLPLRESIDQLIGLTPDSLAEKGGDHKS